MVSRIYLHYPFCLSYCRYCNFSAGAPPKEEYTTPYFHALLKEAKEKHHYLGQRLDSLYLGGGTPSLMPLPHMDELFNFYAPLFHKGTEITLEINPESVTAQRAKTWKALGINRVSLGWQSMDDSTLKLLNRSGRAADNIKAFSLLREAGFDNISVDRILSVSGDSSEGFYSALQKLLPEHVSTYQLSIEERTVLHRWAQTGAYHPLSDSKALSLEDDCNSVLASLGFQRYEISNYARNNKIGRHNYAYWDFCYYLGLGAGASGYVPAPPYGKRTANAFSFKDYLKGIPAEEELLSPLTAIKEALMVGVRKRAGIDKKAFTLRHGIEWASLFTAPPSPYFFTDSPSALILKEKAIPLCNPAVLSLWDNLDPKLFPPQ